MTIDFWCVSAKAGLLSRTSTLLSASALRVSSLSAEPSRRCGLSITRTLTPRARAAFTALTMSGSVNRNMRMLIDVVGSVERIDQHGWAVSSGRTMPGGATWRLLQCAFSRSPEPPVQAQPLWSAC